MSREVRPVRNRTRRSSLRVKHSPNAAAAVAGLWGRDVQTLLVSTAKDRGGRPGPVRGRSAHEEPVLRPGVGEPCLLV
jgi:hypothetical protein